jgi:diaminopimelate decarboxylase
MTDGHADTVPSTAASDSPAVRRLADWDADRLVGLAEEYGTPLYVTDLDRVRDNYARFAAAFPDAHVMYAAKANTGRAVVQALDAAGAPMEVAAAGEMERVLRAGVDPGDVRYTAVNPPDADLDYVVEKWRETPSLTVTVGAESTIDRLIERGFDGRLVLRVNPGIGTGHHEKVATGKDAKFGIPHDNVPEVAADVRASTDLDLVGLHMHVGSGVLDDDLPDHCRAVERLADVAREVGDLEFVDIGGGFGVPYHPDEEPLDLAATADAVRTALGDLDADLHVEPGRYVVADASVILARVNTRKEALGATVVGVDASMTTLLRPAMFDSYHPMRNLTGDLAGREPEPVSVGGPICSSADVFCQDRPLARVDRDDVLAIGNGGAYGYELALQFHSQPRPAEVALEGGDARIVRRRETVDDLVRVEDEASGLD